MALLFLGWNYTITGDAFRTGYQATGVTFFDAPLGDGADARRRAARRGARRRGRLTQSATGMQNERMQLALLLLVLHGWPLFVGLASACCRSCWAPVEDCTTGSSWPARCRHGRLGAVRKQRVMYGPRYWYEAMPFLFCWWREGWIALPICLLAVLRLYGTESRVPAAALGPRGRGFGSWALLVAFAVYGWLLGNRTTWQADLVPNRASAMCCVLGVDDRIHRLVEEQDLHNALVLVDPCGNNFVCYGSVFWRNEPILDGDIVYAKDIRRSGRRSSRRIRAGTSTGRRTWTRRR